MKQEAGTPFITSQRAEKGSYTNEFSLERGAQLAAIAVAAGVQLPIG